MAKDNKSIENGAEIDVEALSDEEASKLLAEMDEASNNDVPEEPTPGIKDEDVSETKADDKDKTDESAADDDGMDKDATDKEVDAEPDETTKKDKDETKQDTVSHQRFHHERERRKEIESKLEKAQERETVLLERMEKIIANPSQVNEKDPQLPGADDPVARVNYIFERMQQQERANQETEQQQQVYNNEQKDLGIAYSQANAEMVKGGEIAQSAMDALKESYVGEYRAFGYSDQQIVEAYPQVEAQIVMAAKEQGVNIVDYIKGLATARGWSGEIKAGNPDPKETLDVQSEADKLAARELAKEKAKSLSTSGGTSINTGAITAQQLADMNDNDFADYLEKHGSVDAAMSGVD